MIKISKWIVGMASVLGLWSTLAFHSAAASSAGETHFIYALPPINVKDEASLQRGAKYFMNYCSGCHGIQYMRYSQMAEGTGMTDSQGAMLEALIKRDLMFTGEKMGDPMVSSLSMSQGKQFFGTKVPDLSLLAKSRKPEWIYNYLLSFYADSTRPFGTNNAVFKDVAMPNVFTEIQGIQKPIYKAEGHDADNRPIETIVGFELVKPGTLTPEEFQAVAYDLTNFLAFTADPKKQERERLGGLVIFFLILFTALTYLLKREYWKDVK